MGFDRVPIVNTELGGNRKRSRLTNQGLFTCTPQPRLAEMTYKEGFRTETV